MGFMLHVKFRIYQVFSGDYVKFRIYQVFRGGSLALIIFVVSEKKAFEHFPIESNVNICPAVVAILDFRSA